MTRVISSAVVAIGILAGTLGAPVAVTAELAPPCAGLTNPDTCTVVSDFGPRRPGPGIRFFHGGVDYAFPMSPDGTYGTPVYSLEDGRVTAIALSSTGNYVQVEGISTRRRFTYVHLFGDRFESFGRDEIVAVRLVGGDTGEATHAYLVVVGGRRTGADHIIVFAKKRRDQVTVIKALTRGPRRALRRFDCARITSWSPANDRCFTTDRVKGTEAASAIARLVAVSGDSGTARPHLHVQLNLGNDNPFLYIQHPRPKPTIRFVPATPRRQLSRVDGSTNIGIRVESPSLDLDRLDIEIFGAETQTSVARWEFKYNGRTDAGPPEQCGPAPFTCAGLRYTTRPDGQTVRPEGVHPVPQGSRELPGVEEFYVRWNVGDTSPGRYMIKATATTVLGTDVTESRVVEVTGAMELAGAFVSRCFAEDGAEFEFIDRIPTEILNTVTTSPRPPLRFRHSSTRCLVDATLTYHRVTADRVVIGVTGQVAGDSSGAATAQALLNLDAHFGDDPVTFDVRCRAVATASDTWPLAYNAAHAGWWRPNASESFGCSANEDDDEQVFNGRLDAYGFVVAGAVASQGANMFRWVMDAEMREVE